jgi:molybdenum cofactor cytidylyltransferase
MGRDKALLPWPAGAASGGTFLSAALDNILPSTELVIVVAGSNLASLAATVYARSASLIENPRPEDGQFSSLRLGLREVLNRGRDVALVTLVDRPPASAATVAKLREEFINTAERGIWAVAPEYNGQHGHPIVLGREMIEALLRAPASSNAREVMHANAAHIHYLAVDDPHVVMNINTPEDYQRLSQPVEK